VFRDETSLGANPRLRLRSCPLPTFFLIGAMKAGTTSAYHYLGAHPEIFVPSVKEPDFFSVEANWRRGVDCYAALYARGAGMTARGDCSPSYAMRGEYPEVAARIAALVPDARVMLLVRHPIKRIVSMWVHHVFTGRERRPLAHAVREDPRYVETSRYAWQLDPYLAAFPRERVFVAGAEALRRRRTETVKRLWAAAGVNPRCTVPAAALEAEHHETATKRLPHRLTERGGWQANPRFAPDRRPALVQRLTTRRITKQDLILPGSVERELWRQLSDDLFALRAIVGPDTFAAWGWFDGGDVR
jgi:hypothetical protein